MSALACFRISRKVDRRSATDSSGAPGPSISRSPRTCRRRLLSQSVPRRSANFDLTPSNRCLTLLQEWQLAHIRPLDGKRMSTSHETPSRLSESPIWSILKRLYQGTQAWESGAVPSHMSSNAFVAQRYAGGHSRLHPRSRRSRRARDDPGARQRRRTARVPRLARPSADDRGEPSPRRPGSLPSHRHRSGDDRRLAALRQLRRGRRCGPRRFRRAGPRRPLDRSIRPARTTASTSGPAAGASWSWPIIWVDSTKQDAVRVLRPEGLFEQRLALRAAAGDGTSTPRTSSPRRCASSSSRPPSPTAPMTIRS